jgi:hypothetical protein
MPPLMLADINKIARTPEGLWRKHVAITKSDDTTYDPPLRGLLVMGAGDVTAVDLEGNSVLYSDCPASFFIHALLTKVMSTGTDATNLISGY